MTRERSRADGSPSDRWWYWLVLTPLFAGALSLFGLGLGVTVVLGEGTALPTLAPAFFVLGLLAAVFAVAFPLALYADASAVAERSEEWQPQPTRYAVAGVATVASGFVLAIPLSVYYLAKRRKQVGRP